MIVQIGVMFNVKPGFFESFVSIAMIVRHVKEKGFGNEHFRVDRDESLDFGKLGQCFLIGSMRREIESPVVEP